MELFWITPPLPEPYKGSWLELRILNLKAGARGEGHQSSLRRSGSDNLPLILRLDLPYGSTHELR